MHVYVVGYPVQGVGVLDAKVLVIHVGQNNVKGKEGAIVINASVQIHGWDSIGCCCIWIKVVLDLSGKK